MFPIIAPYIVVSKATAIAGPIAEGSAMLSSIATRPIRVPIIPIAPEKPPIWANICAFDKWRVLVWSISISKRSRMVSGSLPSTAIERPFFKKAFSSLFASASSASMPSRLALVE